MPVNSGAKETYPKFATVLSMNAKQSAAMEITATREIFWTQLIKIPAPGKQFISAMVS